MPIRLKTLPLVTFEQAKRLKAAGFDWPTQKAYLNLPSVRCLHGMKVNWCNEPDFGAPAVSLALKWARDVKGIACGVFPSLEQIIAEEPFVLHYYYRVVKGKREHSVMGGFDTSDAAESALLDKILTILEN